MHNVSFPRFLIPVLTLGLLVGSGCKKDGPEAALPPATQEGKNTAGCLVDGQAFVARSSGGGVLSAPLPALGGGFAFDSLYSLTLNGQLNGRGVEIALFVRGQRPGPYALDQTTAFYPQGSPRVVLNHATVSFRDQGREVYGTDAQHTGQVVLTKAEVRNGLSAGTFVFTAVSNQTPGKTVTITLGRFDRRL